MKTTRLAPVVLACLGLACASTKKELERVAKDWCLTIRASQVLPVYPPNEDVQPGDVFLVQVPLAEQTSIYEDKGFLPLDQLVTRLHGLQADYEAFYAASYWEPSYAMVPHPRPGAPDPRSSSSPSNEPPNHLQVVAPRVAFPAYNFSVTKGGGLNLALPLSGVPVGLGVMGASEATGTVSLEDAFTIGLDVAPLYLKLKKWWNTPGVRSEFTRVSAQLDGEFLYLRVVNRVFTSHRVVVSLTNQDAAGAGVDAAAAKVPTLLDFEQDDGGPASAGEVKSSAEAYREALDALSGTLNGSEAGGSVRFAQASSRSVTMDETFARPLVIGYHGFDVPVFPNGELGAPIPSFSLITGQVGAPKDIGQTFAPAPTPEIDELRNSIADWGAASEANEKALWGAMESNGVPVGDSTPTLRILGVSDADVLRRIAAELGIAPGVE